MDEQAFDKFMQISERQWDQMRETLWAAGEWHYPFWVPVNRIAHYYKMRWDKRYGSVKGQYH